MNVTMLPNPHPSRGWFVLLVGAVAAVALTGSFWGSLQAGYLLAAVFAALGLARLFVSPGQLGPLVVRSRTLDATFTLGFALALGVITRALPVYA